MQDFLSFASNVFSHWVALLSGGVGLTLTVVEYVRKQPVLARWFLTVSALCLLIACEQAWQDEHRNSQVLIREKAVYASDLNSCRFSSALKDKDMASLQSERASARQSSDAVHDILSNQQKLLNSQQVQIGGCLISLGKLNPVINTHYQVVNIPLFDDSGKNPPPGQARLSMLLIEVNRKAEPFGILSCPTDFGVASLPQLSPNEGDSFQEVIDNAPRKLGAGKYSIHVQNSARWEDGNPIHFVIMSPTGYVGPCTFTPER